MGEVVLADLGDVVLACKMHEAERFDDPEPANEELVVEWAVVV